MIEKNNISSQLKEINNNDNFSWRLIGLYHYSKKKNKNYQTIQIEFEDTNELKDYKNKIINDFLNFKLNKIESINPFNGYNPKIEMDFIRTEDPLIKNNLDLLKKAINHTDNDLDLQKCNGYILIGEYKNKSITFFKSAKPVMNTKKRTTFISPHQQLKKYEKPIYRFYYTFDCFILDNVLYCLNLNFESMFGITSTMKNIQKEAINDVANSNLLQDDSLKLYCNHSGKNEYSRKFVKYNTEIVEKMKIDKKYRNTIIEKLNLSTNSNGEIILKDEKDCTVFTSFLCDRLARDPIQPDNLLTVSNKHNIN